MPFQARALIDLDAEVSLDGSPFLVERVVYLIIQYGRQARAKKGRHAD
jgi:hypothetical protein